jgi:beta-glucosidase/6-phospho-beta-glucosidase/beta-galactosidase
LISYANDSPGCGESFNYSHHSEISAHYLDKFISSLYGNTGIIGITGDICTPHPLHHHSHHDQQAVERAFQFYLGWFMHPIFSKHGNYPKIMIDRIGELSEKQGFTKSRLPSFTADEIKMIHKTSDFFGINTYTSVQVALNDDDANPAKHKIPSFQHDMGIIEGQDENWETSGSVS